MAGDWIKVEHSTLDKPEIFVMADQLGIDGDAVVGKCLRFWAWVDNNSVDGRVDVKVTAVRLQVDRLCSCKGFTDALISAGWLKVSDDGMSVKIPNFQYHNSESAKERALKTRRQQKWRDKTKGKSVDDCVDGNASTTASTTASIREEKRREEKNKEKNIRDSDESTDFENFWQAVSRRWHGSSGNKSEAKKEFEKLKPSQELIDRMIHANQTQYELAMAAISRKEFSANFKHVCRWIKLKGWDDEEEPKNQHPYASTGAYPITLARARRTGEAQSVDFNGNLIWVSPSGRVS